MRAGMCPAVTTTLAVTIAVWHARTLLPAPMCRPYWIIVQVLGAIAAALLTHHF